MSELRRMRAASRRRGWCHMRNLCARVENRAHKRWDQLAAFGLQRTLYVPHSTREQHVCRKAQRSRGGTKTMLTLIFGKRRALKHFPSFPFFSRTFFFYDHLFFFFSFLGGSFLFLFFFSFSFLFFFLTILSFFLFSFFFYMILSF